VQKKKPSSIKSTNRDFRRIKRKRNWIDKKGESHSEVANNLYIYIYLKNIVLRLKSGGK
jgi:hypothetical protein